MGYSEAVAITYANGREEAGRMLPVIRDADAEELVSVMEGSLHGSGWGNGFGPLLGTGWDSGGDGDPRIVLSLMDDAYGILGRHADRGHGHIVDPAGGWMRATFHVAKALARGMDRDADVDECAAMVSLDGDRSMDAAIRAGGGYHALSPVISAFGMDCKDVMADDCDPVMRGFIAAIAGVPWFDAWSRGCHRLYGYPGAGDLSRDRLEDGLDRIMGRVAITGEEKRGWRRPLGRAALSEIFDMIPRTGVMPKGTDAAAKSIVCMMAALNGLDDRMLALVFGTYRDADATGRKRIVGSLTGLYMHDMMRGMPFSITIPDRDMPDGFMSECLLSGDVWTAPGEGR